ncbi:MAG: HAMP domain-containing sensor histidine kinase [Patescibacteria group bacterium]
MRNFLQFATFYLMLLLGTVELVVFVVVLREYFKRRRIHLLLFAAYFMAGGTMHSAQMLLQSLQLNNFVDSMQFIEPLFTQVVLVGGIFYALAFIQLYAKRHRKILSGLVIVPCVAWILISSVANRNIYGMALPLQSDVAGYLTSPYIPWTIIQLVTAAVALRSFLKKRRLNDPTRSPDLWLFAGNILTVINMILVGIFLALEFNQGTSLVYAVMVTYIFLKGLGSLAIEHPNPTIQHRPLRLITEHLDVRLVVWSTTFFAVFAFLLMNVVSQYFLGMLFNERNSRFERQLQLANQSYETVLEYAHHLVTNHEPKITDKTKLTEAISKAVTVGQNMTAVPGDTLDSWLVAFVTGPRPTDFEVAEMKLGSFLICDGEHDMPVSGCGILSADGEVLAYSGTLPNQLIANDETEIDSDGSQQSFMLTKAGLNWTFYIHAENAATDQAILRILSFVTILTFSFFAIMAFILFYIIRRPIKPLIPLRRAVEQLEAGEQPNEIPENFVDEIGQLSQSFNRMASAIRNRTEDLNEKVRQQDNFIGMTVHELKTPLNAFRWALESMKEEEKNLSVEQKEMADYLLRSSQRMNEMVNSLQSVSRLNRGKISVNIKSVNLEKIAAEAFADLKPLADKKKISLLFYPGIKDGNEIETDVDMVRHAMDNMISNAIKYTPDGGNILVRTSESPQDNSLRFEVEDDGIGIPTANQADIFKQFYRADNTKSSDIEGTGLGLHISQQFIEMLGGTIGFSSEENRGSKFWFDLPISKHEISKK